MKILVGIILGIIIISVAVAIILEVIDLIKRQNANSYNGIYEKIFKRFLDVFLSMGALIVFSPVIVITALLVRVKLGSPVLFKQDRPGKDEQIFKLYKFRTMTDERDINGKLLPDEIRLTKFGEMLRATSLDELPELINILKGDMSIIGPRPLLVRYLPFYTEEEHHRHDVRPGLTGYAQVHGRNYVTWEEKFKMDIEYSRTISFKNDLKILLDTVKSVVKKENIETASSIVHDGVLYQPLDIERRSKLED